MARRKGMFGQSAGQLHPAAGAAIGVGLGTGTAIAIQTFSGYDKWSEAIGAGVGLLAGGAMVASPQTRAAGVAAIVGTLLSNGLRFAQSMLSCKQRIKDLQGKIATATASRADGALTCKQQYDALVASAKASGVLSGFGIVSPEQVPTLGAYAAYKAPVLGAYSAQSVPTLGEVQVEPRQLAAALPVFQGQGDGDVHIMGSAFGATVMG